MLHPIALLCLLVRMVRAAQGIHAGPDGYTRGLSGELRRRRHRSRRVRRYAERVPFAFVEDESTLDAEPVPARVPAPRRPVDTLPQAGTASSTDRVSAVAKADARTDVGLAAVTASAANVPVPTASVAVPAAIVRGRCFMSGRATGARPVESRKLALTVLYALADQAQAHERAYAHAPAEGRVWAEPSRPIGVFERAESAGLSDRTGLVGREAA